MYVIKIVRTLTPDSYKNLDHFEIIYGFYATRFSRCLLGLHDGSLCYLSFKSEAEIGDPLSHLKHSFPRAIFTENQNAINDFASELFNDDKEKNIPVNVTLFGTEFQIAVWKALMKIKPGSTVSYEEIATSIGKQKAVRATASAIANNKIAYVIPCHRVIRKNGLYVGRYRWGVERKTEMLLYEGVCNLK